MAVEAPPATYRLRHASPFLMLSESLVPHPFQQPLDHLRPNRPRRGVGAMRSAAALTAGLGVAHRDAQARGANHRDVVHVVADGANLLSSIPQALAIR